MNREAEAATARAAAEKLQDAAHGGTPVAIPGGIDAGPAPPPEPPVTAHPTAVPDNTPQLPSTEDDRADRVLEGGGRH